MQQLIVSLAASQTYDKGPEGLIKQVFDFFWWEIRLADALQLRKLGGS